MPRGALIALDGRSRSGKSTHAKLLSENLEKEGIPNVIIRIPDPETDTGKLIQQWIASGKKLHESRALRLLFAANCYENEITVYDHLYSGKTVIFDDFSSYKVAYTMGTNGDCSHLKYPGVPNPDLSIYLCLDYKEIAGRGGHSTTDIGYYNKNKLSPYSEMCEAIHPIEENAARILNKAKDAISQAYCYICNHCYKKEGGYEYRQCPHKDEK
jgi:thymidylate kinase